MLTTNQILKTKPVFIPSVIYDAPEKFIIKTY